MLKLVKICIFAAALLGFSTAYAADTAAVPATSKMGVLDMQQIMKESPQVAALNKQLQDQFKPRQEKIAAAQKNMQNEIEKFKKDSTVMSNADKTKLEEKINADQTSLAKMGQSFQQDLNKAQGEAMQKFMGNLQTAVNNVAKQGKYSMIVNRAAVPYYDPSLDVTKQVLADMKS